MVSTPRVRALPSSWQFAFVGAVVSLPVSTVLNRLPNSEATVGAGIMIFGAFVAGAIAAVRSADPDAAGLRAGFLGGALELLVFMVTSGTTTAWPLSRVAFFALASAFVLCLAPVFGLGCGRVGGWVVRSVASRWNSTASTS
ncbi:hypothetical protein C5B91_17710 [Haloferax sp. Atlit-10N]|uniref:DUF5518 domain-containing protein n=1 Tax=unclassified Haloferax TaxID=2625095 RepID=UPI000E27896B|nr:MULTISPECIES: DUF5518 domain-containing protein [unclassified Haloferax]RDZ39852.1 hypothetical protein C5B87_18255 [Haloferax sp. Atlit-16N]RDZ56622.1 hypothetical protein C5B91_17710 [Haloferax sp. Atlit-10N]